MDRTIPVTDGTPPEWARPWLTEGQSVPAFASLWNADSGSRAWALACLSLAKVDQLDEGARQALYRDAATRPRRAMLAELTGRPATSASLRTIEHVDPADFRREDWVALFEIVGRGAGRGGIGHVPVITRALVEQFDAIPPALRVSRLLAAAASVRVADARWLALGDALAALPDSVRTSLVRAARRVDGVCALWDYVFRCLRAGEEAARFPIDAPPLGMLFVPLSSADAMRRQGLAMSNCMASKVRDVLDGEAVYYRWIGAEPAHVELMRLPASRGWTPGVMAGRGNAALSMTTRNAILSAMRRELGERLIEDAAGAVDLDPPEAPGVAVGAAAGREHFTQPEIERVARRLRRIRGRSLAADRGAFCIIDLPNGAYVQFMSRIDRPWYWAEISSHRFVPAVGDFMTQDAVSFLESCNMAWPTTKANFRCSIAVRSDADCERVAAFALGAIRRVFGQSSGAPFKLTVNIPEPTQLEFTDSTGLPPGMGTRSGPARW